MKVKVGGELSMFKDDAKRMLQELGHLRQIDSSLAL